MIGTLEEQTERLIAQVDLQRETMEERMLRKHGQRFLATPAPFSWFGHLTERSGEAVQRPVGEGSGNGGVF